MTILTWALMDWRFGWLQGLLMYGLRKTKSDAFDFSTAAFTYSLSIHSTPHLLINPPQGGADSALVEVMKKADSE